jgi:predicted dehydrogenase
MSPNFTRRQFIKTAGTAALAAAVLPVYAQSPGKITVAFVGVAHIHTPGYLNLVKNHSGTQIKYVWDHDPDRAAKRASEVGASVPADLNAIWSDPEITAVIILSETNRHHELVLAAAKAGKAVYAEKPMGINAQESLEMADAIEKAGIIFTTGYFMRTDPKHLFLKGEIEKGHFGVITRVRGSNCHNGSLGGWFDTEWRWMADPKIAGVGAFGDLGTHKLDILMWLFGGVESVTADIRPVTHRYGDCDETGEAMISFKSGVIGTLAAGWVDIDDPVKLLISGTRGHAVVFNDQLYYHSEDVSGSDSNQVWRDLPPATPEPMIQFLDAVGGAKGEPLVTPSEAAERVVVMSAMYKAARKREWVKIAA